MLRLETGRVALCAGVLTGASPAAAPVSGDMSLRGPTEDCLRTVPRPRYVCGVDCAMKRKERRYFIINKIQAK